MLGQAEGPGVCYLAEFLRRWSRSSSSSGAVEVGVVEEEEEEVAGVFVSGERECVCVNGKVEGCGTQAGRLVKMVQAEWAGRD
jgi:hypothetical protein